MKTHSICSSVFVIVFLFMSCKKDTESTPKTYDIAGTFQTVSIPLSDPPNQQMKITGNGIFSHLGNASFEVLSTLVIVPPPPFNLSGTSTIVVENKGEIYTTFTGTSDPQPDGLFLVLFNHIITGGSGKFEKATGHITGTAYTDRMNPNGSTALEGKITY